MKALLRYGPFTHLIDIPRILPTLRIIKPPALPTMVATEQTNDILEISKNFLEFRPTHHIEEDIMEYIFVSEA